MKIYLINAQFYYRQDILVLVARINLRFMYYLAWTIGSGGDQHTFANNRLVCLELSDNKYNRIGQVLVTHSAIFLASLHNITGHTSTKAGRDSLSLALSSPFRHFSH